MYIVLTKNLVSEYAEKLRINRKELQENIQRLKRRLSGKTFGLNIISTSWIKSKIAKIPEHKHRLLKRARELLREQVDIEIVKLTILRCVNKVLTTDFKLYNFIRQYIMNNVIYLKRNKKISMSLLKRTAS